MEEENTERPVIPEPEGQKFSLVIGGPFSELLNRLRLNGADHLPHARAGLILALFAWLPPAILAVAQSLTEAPYSGWGYFTDFTVYTRYLIAIAVMVATERYADVRVNLILEQFGHSHIISGPVNPQFRALLRWADRQSASRVAEALILVATLAWSVFITDLTIELSEKSWEGTFAGGAEILSWAGTAAAYISTPLFLFLAVRWLWRFFVWTLLLYRISRLPLQLAPLHPDKAAGLGFLSIYPSVFTGFVFAMSCVVASSILKELGLETHDPSTVWLALAVWMAFIMGMFLGPLLVFITPLANERRRALLDYGQLASEHHLLFHREWVEKKKSGAELFGSPIPSSISDLNASVQAVRDMQSVPIDLAAFIQLFLASGLPLLAVVLKLIPLGDLVQWVVGSVL